MEQSRAHTVRLLGEQAGPPGVPVFIVEARHRMKELTGTAQNAWSNPKVISFVYGDPVKAIGAHEDCHILARRFWGSPHADWLDEGLAIYSDDEWWGHPLHGVAKLLQERGQLIPIASLLKTGWKKNSDLVTYPETGSFVKCLYEKYGVDAVKQTWKDGSNQIPRIFGKKVDDLEQEWRATIAATDATGIKYTHSLQKRQHRAVLYSAVAERNQSRSHRGADRRRADFMRAGVVARRTGSFARWARACPVDGSVLRTAVGRRSVSALALR
jgi:hypothetical protein